MVDLNKVMSPTEAADRWGVDPRTLRARLHGATKPMASELELDLKAGLLKKYLPEGKQRAEWILTEDYMFKWYGAEPKK